MVKKSCIFSILLIGTPSSLFLILELLVWFNCSSYFVEFYCISYTGFSYVAHCSRCLSPAVLENRIATAQCLSGTGSLRVGSEFLARHYHQVCSHGLLHRLLKVTIHWCEDQTYPCTCCTAHNIHSTTNMGKPPKSFHFRRVECKELPILWPDNTGSGLTRL